MVVRAKFSLQGACMLLAIFSMQACTVLGPDYERPGTDLAADWQSDSLNSAPKTLSEKPGWTEQGQWWRHFNDPALDLLIAEVLEKNHSLKVAALRLMEARAQQAIAGSTQYPQVQQLSGSLLNTERRQSGGSSTNQWLYGTDLSIAWELDFWGRFRRGMEAADANFLASLAKYNEVAILLAAQTAQFYVAIRTLESRLNIAHSNAAIQKRSLEITERLFKSGNEAELDVQQAKTQYLATLASIPPLEASLRQTQNALAVLLARPPGPISEMSNGTGVLPQASLEMVADLPADMLRRRPDIRAAEMQLVAQSSLIGIAEADLYPSLVLLGSLGVSASSTVRRLETAQAAREQARAKVVAAQAEVVRAEENMGGDESNNAKLESARLAIAKAELDLKRTRVVAPARGLITDLSTDAGHFTQAGAPAMTLIAIHDVWINAELTENNLGNVKIGNEVGVVLDVMPGTVLKGKVRSIGNGVSSGKAAPAGSLPTIENNRDWLRQSQRFPVAIELAPSEIKRIAGVRVGGQADVMIYTGESGLMNVLGGLYLRMMSLLSYVY